MSLLRLPKKFPPGLRFTASLLCNWKLLSLPLILSAVFKPNFWQAVFISLVALAVSSAALIFLRDHHYAKRRGETGAEFPPLIPSKTFGGLDIVQALRRETQSGYLGMRISSQGPWILPQSERENVSRRSSQQLGAKIRAYGVHKNLLGASCGWMNYTTYFWLAEGILDRHLRTRVYQGVQQTSAKYFSSLIRK